MKRVIFLLIAALQKENNHQSEIFQRNFGVVNFETDEIKIGQVIKWPEQS